jgi:hypothetical protein
MIDDDDLITVLISKHGMGAADAAGVAQALSPYRLRELLAYIETNPPAHPPNYILAAVAKERSKRRRAAPVEQLPLKPPGPLEQKREAITIAEPPADNSWQTDEERRARTIRAAGKLAGFPQYAEGASS